MIDLHEDMEYVIPCLLHAALTKLTAVSDALESSVEKYRYHLSVLPSIGYQMDKETYLLRAFAYTPNSYSFPLFTLYSVHRVRSKLVKSILRQTT